VAGGRSASERLSSTYLTSREWQTCQAHRASGTICRSKIDIDFERKESKPEWLQILIVVSIHDGKHQSMSESHSWLRATNIIMVPIMNTAAARMSVFEYLTESRHKFSSLFTPSHHFARKSLDRTCILGFCMYSSVTTRVNISMIHLFRGPWLHQPLQLLIWMHKIRVRFGVIWHARNKSRV
jgi:hypothetical protein